MFHSDVAAKKQNGNMVVLSGLTVVKHNGQTVVRSGVAVNKKQHCDTFVHSGVTVENKMVTQLFILVYLWKNRIVTWLFFLVYLWKNRMVTRWLWPKYNANTDVAILVRYSRQVYSKI